MLHVLPLKNPQTPVGYGLKLSRSANMTGGRCIHQVQDILIYEVFYFLSGCEASRIFYKALIVWACKGAVIIVSKIHGRRDFSATPYNTGPDWMIGGTRKMPSGRVWFVGLRGLVFSRYTVLISWVLSLGRLCRKPTHRVHPG